jgi:hypothetical protein
VVEDSAVKTVDGAGAAASSALAAEFKPTIPTAAKPNVHLLNFIGSSSV